LKHKNKLSKTLISIIIPVYNREQHISETLDSVRSQTYTNWECIIVDDGSSDNTEAIVNTFTQSDNRFNFYKRSGVEKKGASSCRNYGIQKAKGELIQFLDSDDLLAKNKFEEQVKLYKSGSLTLISCKWGGFVVSEDLSTRFKYKYHSYKNFKRSKELLRTFGKYEEFFPLHVYLIPKVLIDKSGNWNEDLTNNDDAEFFARVILNSSGILFSDKTSVYYRYSGEDNLSALNSSEKIESAIKSWKLIEAYMKQNCLIENSKYVLTGKLILYNTIKNKYPDLILENSEFFNDKQYSSSPFKKILKWLGLNRY
jgi:glycosyltransferase involved in cell wall biosynthesis